MFISVNHIIMFLFACKFFAVGHHPYLHHLIPRPMNNEPCPNGLYIIFILMNMSLSQWCPQIISQIPDNPPPPNSQRKYDMVMSPQGLNVCGMSLLRTSIAFCFLLPLFFVACTGAGVLLKCPPNGGCFLHTAQVSVT